VLDSKDSSVIVSSTVRYNVVDINGTIIQSVLSSSNFIKLPGAIAQFFAARKVVADVLYMTSR
jgi:hypothetical protein